jgi:flagellar biosynthesis protein FlhG
MDQASRLREFVMSRKTNEKKEDDPKSAPVKKHESKVIAISSGKGGVGKTNFTVNLALSLAKRGNRITIIDADLGLANVDVLLGIIPEHTLLDVVRKGHTIEEVLVEGPFGIKIISGGSGVKDLVNLSGEQVSQLIESFENLNHMSDYILIDTGAGISNSVISFLDSADDVIIVVTPDPTSITDAYALIKTIRDRDKCVKLVVNRVDSNKEGAEVFEKISVASKRFLQMNLENLGYIYDDPYVKKAVRSQNPFMISYPNSLASKGVDIISYNLENNSRFISKFNSFNNFMSNLFKGV